MIRIPDLKTTLDFTSGTMRVSFERMPPPPRKPPTFTSNPINLKAMLAEEREEARKGCGRPKNQ